MNRRRQFTKPELRALGATPRLMARRYDADGRARLEQLTSEASGRPSLFFAPRFKQLFAPRRGRSKTE